MTTQPLNESSESSGCRVSWGGNLSSGRLIQSLPGFSTLIIHSCHEGLHAFFVVGDSADSEDAGARIPRKNSSGNKLDSAYNCSQSSVSLANPLVTRRTWRGPPTNPFGLSKASAYLTAKIGKVDYTPLPVSLTSWRRARYLAQYLLAQYLLVHQYLAQYLLVHPPGTMYLQSPLPVSLASWYVAQSLGH